MHDKWLHIYCKAYFLISLGRRYELMLIWSLLDLSYLVIMATYTQSQETPEYRTFREHYHRLVYSISDPLPLATRLFARSIIDSTLLQRVNIPVFPTSHNTNTLLTAVLGKIQNDPSTFCVFLLALNEDPSMQVLVETMKSKLKMHLLPGRAS